MSHAVARERPMPLADETIPNVILSRKRDRSRKPDIVRHFIVRMYPDARRLEKFARSRHPGWLSWGNEVGEDAGYDTFFQAVLSDCRQVSR